MEQLLGVTIGDDPRALERAGRAILEQSRLRAVLITRGSRGMALFEPGRRTQHIGVYGSDEVADVTGAGDTVIAPMALALSVGASSLADGRGCPASQSQGLRLADLERIGDELFLRYEVCR